MIHRSALASQGTARAGVAGSAAAPVRETLRHTRGLLVGLVVLAAIFADLARTSVTRVQIPDGPPFSAPDD